MALSMQEIKERSSLDTILLTAAIKELPSRVFERVSETVSSVERVLAPRHQQCSGA